MENLRSGLEKAILGQKIKRVIVKKPKLVSGKGNVRQASRKKTHEFAQELIHERILAVERRAKNLIFKLTHGKIILAHLKMSGQFAYKHRTQNLEPILGGHPIELSERELPNKHTYIIFELEKGALYYNDTRMFGYVLYYPSAEKFEAENHFGAYGLEPLDKQFTITNFELGIKKSKAKIKSLLMSQKIVVGLGNIYADESLFEAGIRPDRSAASLTQIEVKALSVAIKRIIKRAIKAGGSSVVSYRLLDNTRGNYARELKVYSKAGKNCPRCGYVLKKSLINNRTTVYCSKCQK